MLDIAKISEKQIVKNTKLFWKGNKMTKEREEAPMFLTAKEMSDVLGINEKTFAKMVKEGMPSVKIGERPKFDLSDVLDWLKNRSGDKFEEDV